MSHPARRLSQPSNAPTCARACTVASEATWRFLIERVAYTAAEVLWEGTHSDPLESPGGTLQPSGRRLRFYSSFWMRWGRDRLTDQHNTVDILGMLTQIGALPTPSDI